MRRDPVTPDVANAVLERDGYLCVGPRVWMPGTCDGRLELDHIANLGMALRGPSRPENLVTLCSRHHRMKTEHGRTWRPVLLKWVSSHDGTADGG